MIAMPFWGPPKYSRRESQGWKKYWNDGGVINSSYNIDAPQFRDYNNTGFYVNPAGQSHMNTLTLQGNRIGFINASFDAEIRVSDSNPNGAGAEFIFYGDGGSGNAQTLHLHLF